MKVILKQDVEKLGKAGEIVKVAPGYGRNYLIPRKIALEATPGNLKISEIERTVGARRDQRDKQAASLVARDLASLVVTVRTVPVCELRTVTRAPAIAARWLSRTVPFTALVLPVWPKQADIKAITRSKLRFMNAPPLIPQKSRGS